MKISNQKLLEIKKEVLSKKTYLKKELEEGVNRGGPMDSFKEAAAVSANLQAHNQKLRDLEKILREAEDLPDYVKGDAIVLGKWFEIEMNNTRTRYRLVESIEADINSNLLSIESPLGMVLINKKKNDKIDFNGSAITITSVE